MVLMTANQLSRSVGMRVLFDDVTFGIEERDRIAIIGANGSGKSTLLRLMAGLDEPESGYLQRRREMRLAFQAQAPDLPGELSVIDYLFSNNSTQARLVRDYEKICHRIEHEPQCPELMKQFEELTHRMDAEGAWEYETRAKTILTQLGICDFDVKIATLSGGYRKKISLAQALLTEADLLILDEPTNHLDADTVAWLERYLLQFNGALVLVTHDRYFLDRVVTRIFEIERGRFHVHEGTFSAYLENKAERETRMETLEARRQNLARKELEWLRTGPKARTTKSKARVDAAHTVIEQRFTENEDKLELSIGQRRLGKRVLEIRDLCKSFGDNVLLENFEYSMKPRSRLGIIGPNGCGKSTLVNIITGKLEPDAGYLGIGKTVHFGYFDQESEALNPLQRAIDFIKSNGGEMIHLPDDRYLTAELMMEQFLFDRNMQYTPNGKLSGGEQRRLYLIRTLMRDPNFLILDEPTNDLDIPTLQALEDMLDRFKGSLVVVSHDRYFLDRTVDHILAFEGQGKWKIYPGNYSMYTRLRDTNDDETRQEQQSKREANEERFRAEKRERREQQAPRLSYMEKRRLAELEEIIPKLEAKIEALEAEMVEFATDFGRMQKASQAHTKAQAELETAMEAWEILAAKES